MPLTLTPPAEADLRSGDPAVHKPAVKQQDAYLEALGDEIARLSSLIQATTYRLLVLLRELDDRGGWCGGAARSCAHWLSWRTGLALGAAREKVRVARALASLPHISGAMSRGEISYSKVRAMTRIATPENEEDLLRLAQTLATGHLERLVRAWRKEERRLERKETEERHLGRSVSSFFDDDGMMVLRIRLEPEAGAVVLRALDAARDRLYENDRLERGQRDGLRAERPSIEQRRADGLVLVAESAMKADLDPGTRGDRYQVVVHVDAEALTDHVEDVDSEEPTRGQSALADGPRVSAETSRRLACDASRIVMTHAGDGSVLDVGRKTRTVPPALRRALEHRDGSCRFPGCSNRAAFCDAHHVEHWADGGETRLENLVLLCRWHHRFVHEEGYRVEPEEPAELRFFTPRGQPIPTVPDAPILGVDPEWEMDQVARRRGIEIGPKTMPVWCGEAPDLSWTIDYFLGE
jgi:hypothetical protein